MKLKASHIAFVLVCLVFVFFLADTSLAQCSMCRKIATDGANSKAVGTGLNKGILYLLAMPYCLIAFFFRKQIFDFVQGLRKK